MSHAEAYVYVTAREVGEREAMNVAPAADARLLGLRERDAPNHWLPARSTSMAAVPNNCGNPGHAKLSLQHGATLSRALRVSSLVRVRVCGPIQFSKRPKAAGRAKSAPARGACCFGTM